MRLNSMKNMENIMNLPYSMLTFYYSVEINGAKQKSTFIIDHFVQQKKNEITLQKFNIQEMNNLDSIALSSKSKIEFIVFLQYDIIYSSLMNYSCHNIDKIGQSHYLSTLSPSDLKNIIISYISQPNKMNETDQQKQQIVQALIQNWMSSIENNNNVSEEQLIEMFKHLELRAETYQYLHNMINQKNNIKFYALLKVLDDKVKTSSNISMNQSIPYNKPRQNSEDLGNSSPKRNSHAPAPMSLRTSHNTLKLDQDELVKKYTNTLQNKSEVAKTNYMIENTPGSTLPVDLQGFNSAYIQQQFGNNKSKTNRIQESIRQIASPKIPISLTTRTQELGYMNLNSQGSMSTSSRAQNQQLTNGKIENGLIGPRTPARDIDIKSLTQKYLGNNNQQSSLSKQNGGFSNILQTETGNQNNYDLKRLLSPTIDRTNVYNNSESSNQIRFLSPGPVLETTKSQKSQLNEYFNTEQTKKSSKNHLVQKREISLTEQSMKFRPREQDLDLNLQNQSSEDIRYRIKSPQPTDFSKRDTTDMFSGTIQSQFKLDSSSQSEFAPSLLISKLKSENDLDLIRQLSPKIAPTANSKVAGSFVGSAVTSPLTKKINPNFNSEAKRFDIQPYRLVDLNANNQNSKTELVQKQRDSSVGVSEIKGFSINDIESNKNFDFTNTLLNIKVNSIADMNQEYLNTKKADISEYNNVQQKVINPNQLFAKALQNSNGLNPNQRISTLQNLFSSSNIDNQSQPSNSALSEIQNTVLPAHIIQERTAHKMSVLNQINMKQFALSEELKLAFS